LPRDLPLGNGDFLVTFDSDYQLRDLYYPNVGQENHTTGEPCRFGVWADGAFVWISDSGWQRRIDYEHETLVGNTHLNHPALKLSLYCRDAVDFDRNIYFKEVTVEDTSGKDREVRLFHQFDANLYGNGVGDSAYYDPRSQSIVHYKLRRYFLLSGSAGGHAFGLSSFAIGRAAPGSSDGVLLVSFVTRGGIGDLGFNLLVRGTVAVALPAQSNANACSVLGLENLEFLDPLTF